MKSRVVTDLPSRYNPAGGYRRLEGARFGRLTAVYPTGHRGLGLEWLCACDCGQHIVTSATALQNKKTSSCGCSVSEAHSRGGRRGENRREIVSEGVRLFFKNGESTLVDVEDLELVRHHKWFLINSHGVVATVNRRKVLMHRIILAAHGVNLTGLEVDHINHDRLDNRKSNLRPATRGENQWNVPKLRTNSTGYKGVSLDKRRGKYVAQIRLNKKHVHLGQFVTAEAAALAYNRAAREHHGEFACLNRVKLVVNRPIALEEAA